MLSLVNYQQAKRQTIMTSKPVQRPISFTRIACFILSAFVCAESYGAQHWITTLNDGASGNTDIRAIVSDGSGGVYVGGAFSSIDGSTLSGNANNVARWNSGWSALGTGRPNDLYALTMAGSTLYAGGNAYFVGDYFSSWSGSSWTAINGLGGVSPSSPPIKTLLASGSSIYAGGTFGAPDNVAVYNGSWTALTLAPSGYLYVRALAEDNNGDIYAIMAHTSASQNSLWKYSGGSWAQITVPPPQAGECCNNALSSLAIRGDHLYVGGVFGDEQPGTFPNDLPGYGGIGIYNTVNSSWSSFGSIPWIVRRPTINDPPTINVLTWVEDTLYVGGRMTISSGGYISKYLYKWSAVSGWTSIEGLSISGGGDVVVNVVGVSGDDLYVAGTFTHAQDASGASQQVNGGKIGDVSGTDCFGKRPSHGR
jgi:hypothetical protein